VLPLGRRIQIPRADPGAARDTGRVGGQAIPEGADFQCKGEAVNGFGGRVKQKISDVGEALLVFHCGVLTVEGEVPKAEAFRRE